MATFLRNNLKETAVHWVRGANDGFGHYTFTAGVEVKVRWEDRSEAFKTPDGREIVSSSIVYADVDMTVGDFIFLGSLTDLSSGSDTDPYSEDHSVEVVLVETIKSLDTRNVVRRIVVTRRGL